MTYAPEHEKELRGRSIRRRMGRVVVRRGSSKPFLEGKAGTGQQGSRRSPGGSWQRWAYSVPWPTGR
jgi:hypothetical protein